MRNIDFTHGSGTKISKRIKTAAEALDVIGDYEVAKRPLLAQKLDGTQYEVPGGFQTVRTDNEQHLGIVGNRFHPIQNREAFSFFDFAVKEKVASYVKGGTIKGGAKIWLLAELNNKIVLPGDDVVNKYILMMNGFDGWTVLMARLTPLRVWCGNQLPAMLHGIKNQVRIRHTPNAEKMMQMAHKILGIADQYYKEIEPIYQGMALRNVTDAMLEEYLTNLFPDPKPAKDGKVYNQKAVDTRQRVREIFETSSTIDGTKASGTLWGAYNAVTEYVDWHKPVLDELADTWRRFDNTWLGTGAELKQEAFRISAEMLN